MGVNERIPEGWVSLYEFSRKYGYDLVDLVVAKDRGLFESQVFVLRKETPTMPSVLSTIVREDLVPPPSVRRADYRGEIRGQGNYHRYTQGMIAAELGVSGSTVGKYLADKGLRVMDCYDDEDFAECMAAARERQKELQAWCLENKRGCIGQVWVAQPAPDGHETVKRASVRFGVSTTTMYDWIDKGLIEYIIDNDTKYVKLGQARPIIIKGNGPKKGTRRNATGKAEGSNPARKRH